MFALFPYLSIYLQDILGTSPLGAGLRFLPLTAFVFLVPIATRGIVQRVQPWVLASLGLLLVAIGLLLMHGLTTGSRWTALLPGFVVGGVGIGLANPTLAASALWTVDPARSGMASGINNAFRLSGVAIGVAALGAVLEDRVSKSLASTAHVHSRTLAAAVSSAGTRAVGGEFCSSAFGSGRFRERTERGAARWVRDRFRRRGCGGRADARSCDRPCRGDRAVSSRGGRKPRHLRGILSAASFRI